MNESPDPIDVLLGRKKSGTTINSSTVIKNVQNRIHKALENGYEYARSVDLSEEYLRRRAFRQISMAVLYVDLVDSTKMSLKLPADKLSILISSFSQEMAFVINAYNGYVLKFIGDAVIGYFVEDEMSQFRIAENAVSCAESMIKIVEQGINPIVVEKIGLSEIGIKIGIDFGKNVVVRYGDDEKRSHVDLLGPTMNVASKIQNLAKPNQILVGQNIYKILHPMLQKFFLNITDDVKNNWQHYFEHLDQVYRVYQYKHE